MNTDIDSKFPPILFFSFFWVMDDLSSKEGISLQASAFLTDSVSFMWSIQLYMSVSSDIRGPPMTSSLIGLSRLVDLPQKALNLLAALPTSCWGICKSCESDLRSICTDTKWISMDILRTLSRLLKIGTFWYAQSSHALPWDPFVDLPF